MIEEGKENCAMAGMQLARDYYAFVTKSPTVFQANLKGLVDRDDWKIPYSELADHQGAAGKEIIAFFISDRLAFAIYQQANGGCGYIHGLHGEILTNPLIEKTQEMFGTGPRASRA